MIFFPMRDHIQKIEVGPSKKSIRLKCANAAQWIWAKQKWPETRTYWMYSAQGIINAKRIMEHTE